MSKLQPASHNGEATTYTALDRERSPILLFANQRTESAFNEIPVMYISSLTSIISCEAQPGAAIYKVLQVRISLRGARSPILYGTPVSTLASFTVQSLHFWL